MKCKCKAKPKPEVVWYRGTTVVKESSKIKIRTVDIEEEVFELTLEIKASVTYKYISINIINKYFYHCFRIQVAQMVEPTDVMLKTNLVKAMPI